MVQEAQESRSEYLVSCPAGGVWGRHGTLRLQAGAIPAAPSHKRALFALPGWALTREGITGVCSVFPLQLFWCSALPAVQK